jgi:hypothetical protein
LNGYTDEKTAFVLEILARAAGATPAPAGSRGLPETHPQHVLPARSVHPVRLVAWSGDPDPTHRQGRPSRFVARAAAAEAFAGSSRCR